MMVVAKQSSRHKMWTEITRRKYEREGQRYASDLTDAEWALIEPHMPAVKPLGRPRATELRKVLDAILYIARKRLSVANAAQGLSSLSRRCKAIFYDWRDNGLFETINFHLLVQARGWWLSEPVGGGDRQSIGQDDRERRAARWSPPVLGRGKSRDPGMQPRRSRGASAILWPHWRSAGRGRGASRRYPRSRWCGSGHQGDSPAVSLVAPSVRRQRL